MKHPNFFIIGAPKCGTTSLAAWLADHPQVYMSPLKEPRYFNFDHRVRGVRTARAYERLFRGASPSRHLAVGEATPWYLYSKVAAREILRAYGPDVRMIAMLRNPIEMAPSMHRQWLYSRHEKVEDFERAWRLQDERRQGRGDLRKNVEPLQFVYGDLCKLGEQLERLYSEAPKQNVLTILLDDLRLDPRKEYLRILEFLHVPDDGRRDFAAYNSAKTHRIPWLQDAIMRAVWTKHRLGIHRNFGIARLNQVPKPRENISAELHAELVKFFKEDIDLLGRLIRRDLKHWVARGAVDWTSEPDLLIENSAGWGT